MEEDWEFKPASIADEPLRASHATCETNGPTTGFKATKASTQPGHSKTSQVQLPVA